MDPGDFLTSPSSANWGHHNDFVHPDAGIISYATPLTLEPNSTSMYPNFMQPNTPAQQRTAEHHDTSAKSVAPPESSDNRQLPPKSPEPDSNPSSRRSKYGNLDWERHKPILHQIYIQENNSLADTTKKMRTLHSFDASPKLYKTKFKMWGWNKNLPVPVAKFMVEKSKKRKIEKGRDTVTVFSYGGREYDERRARSTLSRTKPPDTGNMDVASTPDGVTYGTPMVSAVSPLVRHPVQTPDHQEHTASTRAEAAASPVNENERLSIEWNNIDRVGLLSMLDEGRASIQEGRLEDAERLLKQAFEGFSHINGATNEDAKKVAFELLDLLAQRGDIHQVNQILERLLQAHIHAWGVHDKRAQQYVLHAVEFLEGCNRHEDAFALLSRSKEILQSKTYCCCKGTDTGDRKNEDQSVGGLVDAAQHLNVVDLDEPIDPESSASHIDYRIGIARSHAAVKDQGVEKLLLALIIHCEKNPQKFHLQLLRARGELLGLYVNLGVVAERGTVFSETPNKIIAIFDSYPWDTERYTCLDVMEAYMQVVAHMLKGGYSKAAKPLFQKVAQKAEALFGYETDRAIWVVITIGIVYQTHSTWKEAAEWFQRAYMNVLANDWGESDGICMALKNGLQRRHFSYLSEEGRPFKSIFGVTGLTIRPNRLHLD